jgi:hypothetical protein
VVVFCQDIVPDTVAKTYAADCTLRKYLDVGGKVVVYADIPLWNVGHADNTRTSWWEYGMAGVLDIPGMNWRNNTNSEVTITGAGVEWGLTKTWTSVRWTPVDDPDAFTILATDRNGNAAAWVKHFVPGDTTRGFVRIFDVDVWRETVNPPSIEDLLRVAEYGLPGYPEARVPNPRDGGIHEQTWINLSWISGAFATSHDVYMGENFDDVNNGTGDTFRGNQASTFYVAGFPGFVFEDGLVPGTTYYWRIDEVNDADPNSPWKGDVWNFMIPPKTAYDPYPSDGIASVEPDMILSWKSGFGVDLHTVYFGDDFDAVMNATSGVQMEEKAYDPDPLEPGKTYYWRVDESDDAGTYKGDVWSFTTSDFLLLDDFESYTDSDADGQAIWQSWIGGSGVADNGAQVGNLLPPYAEQTIVHSGSQSMPVLYNNTEGVWNSHAALSLTVLKDWSQTNYTELSLWFRGIPSSTGSFAEDPAGTYTMTASGAGIWNNGPGPGEHYDQFHFAYKTLNGPGSIIARVESILETHPFTPAGVMIRETLDGGSKHHLSCVTTAIGVSSMGRADIGGTTFYTNQGGFTAPYWVRLERDAAGNFLVSHSADGTTWQPVAGDNSPKVTMGSDVYIGLALTSRTSALTTEAVFSNVTMTGNVGEKWMSRDIGILSNDAEPLYVAVSDADGMSAVVTHDDPKAAQTNTWNQWVIPLQALSDQGIDLANVDKIAVGLGTKSGVTGAGGSGRMYIDDIRLR